MNPEGPGWVAGLPAGATFFVLAGALVLIAVAVRLVLARTRAGRRALAVLHTAESGFVALLLATMLGFSFLQIILRNLARTGLVWIDPFLRHLLLWIGFSGAALATRLDRHINIDALTRVLSPGGKRVAGVATHGTAAVVCLVLAEATLRVVRDEAAAGTVGFLDIPTWMLQTIMPLACLLMSYRCARLLVGDVRSRAPETVPAQPGGDS